MRAEDGDTPGTAVCALDVAAARALIAQLGAEVTAGAPERRAGAVATLVDLLDHWKHGVREAAARALVAAYRAGVLDPACARAVLAHEARMAAPHTDRTVSDDYCRREPGRGWYHVDTGYHVDGGIGVGLGGEGRGGCSAGCDGES